MPRPCAWLRACYSHAMRKFLFALLFLFSPAFAQDGSVVRIDPLIRNGLLLINADIVFTPNSPWRHSLTLGLPAYFTADLELVQPRWWWFDKTIVTARKTWKVDYNTLTRQWRIGSGDLSVPAASLDEALDHVRYIRNWVVAEVDSLDTDIPLRGRLRVRLDTSLLGQALQIKALNNEEWTLSTPWKTFSFSVEMSPSAP